MRPPLPAIFAAVPGSFTQLRRRTRELKVGVTVGPHAQIGEVAQQVAAKQGLKVKLIESADFIQPPLDAK